MRPLTVDTIIQPEVTPDGRTVFAPDGRWFGAVPETVVAVDGEPAEAFIPRIRYVIENYRFRAYGDYSAWPGPNSNTFVRAALDSVPELRAVLPPTAIR